jgi:ABC-type glutathione transport system ATPase component
MGEDLRGWLASVTTHYKKNSLLRPRSFFKRRSNTPSTSSLDTAEKPVEDNEVSTLRSAAEDLTTHCALRVVHLRKIFPPAFVAVRDSSFVMHQGELLAVLGANGSGKSTTCHVLCGITPATAGDVLLDDRERLLALARRGGGVVGWCPQRDILFDELSPLEHVWR